MEFKVIDVKDHGRYSWDKRFEIHAEVKDGDPLVRTVTIRVNNGKDMANESKLKSKFMEEYGWELKWRRDEAEDKAKTDAVIKDLIGKSIDP